VKLALLAIALAGCTSAPCEDVSGTCVVVQVSSIDIKKIDQLQLDVLAGTFHSTATTKSGGTTLPVETALELALPGDLDLGIVAAGKLGGTVLGTGSARLVVASGKHVTATIMLAAPAPCTDGRMYCGGNMITGSMDTLYECHADGVPTARGVCPGICLLRPTLPTGDECMGVGGTCVTPGFYCGGDKVDGDPSSVYQCSSGSGVFVMQCPNGCVIGSPGHDDGCR